MCGRYVVVTKVEEIAKHYQVKNQAQQFVANPNISAGEYAPVISSEDPGVLQLMQFGFTPSWAKKRMFVINARSEGDYNKDNDCSYEGPKGILKKPMFQKSIRSRRCLIPFNAFIEGPEIEKLQRPYLIHFGNLNAIYSFAGIYDEWIDPRSEETFRSFAIITACSIPITQKIKHHRSPVILDANKEADWLDVKTPLEDVLNLLEPYNGKPLYARPISAQIRSPKAKSMDLLNGTDSELNTQTSVRINQQIDLFGMGQTRSRKRKG